MYSYSSSPSSSSFRWILALALGAALVVLAACGETPASPSDTEDAQLQVALEQMVAEANGAGDLDAAVAFSDGLSALRFGVRPSEIEVKVGGEAVRYYAFVTGIAVRMSDGRELTRRTLVAWSGKPRPETILHVSSMTDVALFGFPTDMTASASPIARARGTFADLIRKRRLVATSGPANIVLGGTGEACPKVPADAPFLCVAAQWNLRIEGEFHSLNRRDDRIAAPDIALLIATTADGVNGVVLARKP